MIREKTVDELVPADYGTELRIRGKVGSDVWTRAGVHEFDLTQRSARVRVVTTQMLPIDFRAHVIAIARGTWLDADHTRCVEASLHLDDVGPIFKRFKGYEGYDVDQRVSFTTTSTCEVCGIRSTGHARSAR